ncbi:sarcosine/dimethylglycine N-methyltransferase [Oxalobacteraceae bacterium GrIS 2.11]
MKNLTDTVREHYELAVADQSTLIAELSEIIDGMPKPLLPTSFSSFDQFHVGGLTATSKLSEQLGITSAMHVLDAGSGLGGPSRILASVFGCTVSGVDLSAAYVAVSELIAQKLGMQEQVTYQTGDITSLPFADHSFDVVWSQHVVMNIVNRSQLYQEIYRVLKPGGKFAFYDPIAADSKAPLHYPVPWVETSATTTLLTKQETLDAVADAGLTLTMWDDVTELGIGWLERQRNLQQQNGAEGVRSALSPALVVGQRMQGMVANFAKNLGEERARLAMAIFVKN